MILALKTNGDPTEIYLLDGGEGVGEKVWNAERRLAHDLLGEVERLVGDWTKLSGIIAFKGPGSFTGLRIGTTTANTIAYTQDIPIVGTNGKNWLRDGVEELEQGKNDRIVMPEYGADANITAPKK